MTRDRVWHLAYQLSLPDLSLALSSVSPRVVYAFFLPFVEGSEGTKCSLPYECLRETEMWRLAMVSAISTSARPSHENQDWVYLSSDFNSTLITANARGATIH